MAHPEYAPITGDVLKWAIVESGLSRSDVALRLKVSVEVIEHWESEQSQPTKTQLGKLAQVLKRPSAMFFLAEVPAPAGSQPKFRTAIGIRARRLTSDERAWLRESGELQSVGTWTLQQLDYPPIDLPRFTLEDDPAEVAKRERNRLGVHITDQLGWPNPTTSLASWREAVERQGVLTFQFSIGDRLAPGFSRWDEYAPTITLNRSYNIANRIFTLFHEYGHLLQRLDDVRPTRPTPTMYPQVDSLERWCERFAAHFLLPPAALRAETADIYELNGSSTVTSFEQVKRVADTFFVSYQATVRQLVEVGLAPENLIRRVDRTVKRELRGSGFATMSRLERRSDRFGMRYQQVLSDGLENNVLGKKQVLDLLDLRSTELHAVLTSVEGR